MKTQNPKIKIYIDTGADISFLKPLFDHCEFFSLPYDSNDRRKKRPRVRVPCPSEAQLNDCHIRWDEADFTSDDFSGSFVYPQLQKIIGPDNRRDILHLDSAHKMGADIFLTSDKDDILSKRNQLEQIICYKIYHTPTERAEVLDAISKIRPAR